MTKNITLLGVDYHDVPAVKLPQTGGGMAQFYADLRWGVLRPDAEVVKTWSYDLMAVEDEQIEIPAYTTTATTIRATQDLSEDTYTINYDDYNYYILERMLTIPEYNVTTKGKGRIEYHIASCLYEVAEIPANTCNALIDTSKYATTRSVSLLTTGSFYRSIYYSNSTTLAVYSTSAYSTVQSVVAPAISSGVLTVKTPNWTLRGSTSYFTSTYFNAITDIRYQWICELYRAPKNDFNVDGWGMAQQAIHIIDCANSANHKLV